MLAGGLQLFGTAAVNPACLVHVPRQLRSFAASLQQAFCHAHSADNGHSSAAGPVTGTGNVVSSPAQPQQTSPCSLACIKRGEFSSRIWHSSAASRGSLISLPLVAPLFPARLSGLAFSTRDSTRADSARNPKSRFEDCCDELERHAAKGTSWPQHSKTVLQAVNERVGGRWLLVECGQWTQPRDPKDGQPARALLHLAMGHMPGQGADAQPVKDFEGHLAKHEVKPAKVSKDDYIMLKVPTKKADLPPDRVPFLYLAAYELDKNHWPTGRMYNSVRYFEERTSKAACKKAESSCRVIWGGEDLMTLHNYLRQTAQKPEYGMTKASKAHIFHIADRYRELVESAGVDVMRVHDAASKARQQKQEAEAADADKKDS